MVHDPPSSTARSVMDVQPTPVPVGLAEPRPLSETVTPSVPSSSTSTAQRLAPECLAALVIASEAIRKAATSTAAGRQSSASGPVTSYLSASVESAAAR